MNTRRYKIKLVQILLCLLLITTLLSCNRPTADNTTEQTPEVTTPALTQETEPVVSEPVVNTPVEEVVVEPVVEEPAPIEQPVVNPEPVSEPIPSEPIVEEKVFDDTELGYEVKENKLFLNEKELPAASAISETIKEKDKTTYHFLDGAALVIKSNGDIIVDFPIRITLLIDKDFTTFTTLYKNNPLTEAPIYDFKTEDNWYTVDYGDGTNLKFNNDTLIFNTNNLQIILNSDGTQTIFKDFIISTSNIVSSDALSSIIKIDYEDGTKLTHIVGGSTTFIFGTGTSIESDGETTKIIKDNEETILKGELKAIEFDKETGAISFETTEEKVKIDTVGDIIEKTPIVVEPPMPVEETPAPIEETPVVDEVVTPTPEIAIVEEPVAPVEEPVTAPSAQEIQQEVIGSWEDVPDTSMNLPFRVGFIPNFTFLQKDSTNSDYGLRADLTVEHEIVDGMVIGLQLGLGFDHFTTDGSYKELVTYLTFSQETAPLNSVTSYYYKIKVGSLIPLYEFDSSNNPETPYFRLALDLGVNFNINQNWMVRLGAEAALNYRQSMSYSEAAYLGLIYKFD